MYDPSRATELAIDLAITSGLILAPGRLLLEMEDELKKEEPSRAETEEIQQ
jgi:hypothetical protein